MKLVDISNALIGWVKGSLAVVTVLGSTLFGAISGSAVATCSAIGGMTIPAMKKEGYSDSFAAAIASMASVLGPLIPPSITLIVYASATETSNFRSVPGVGCSWTAVVPDADCILPDLRQEEGSAGPSQDERKRDCQYILKAVSGNC